jgi:hypothetical protein
MQHCQSGKHVRCVLLATQDRQFQLADDRVSHLVSKDERHIADHERRELVPLCLVEVLDADIGSGKPGLLP